MVIANDANSSNAAARTVAGVGASASGVPAKALRHWVERAVKGASDAVGQRYLQRLSGAQSSLRDTMSSVPERLERMSRQSRLVLELLDDVRSGAYRELRWYSVPVAAAALLYTINPADVVPDVLPFVGQLDDVALLAIAVRLLQQDLRAYCRFKGYPEAEYFDPAS